MFDIFKHFEALYPQYDSAYYDSIVFRFAKVGGAKGEVGDNENLRKGKFFSNVYELYIYVTVLGLTVDNPVPLKEGAKLAIFEEMKDWKQHPDLVKFIELALLTKSNIDLNELEDMEEKEVKTVLTRLRILLEQYANSGFQILEQKINENPSYFEDDYCFVNLLSDVMEL